MTLRSLLIGFHFLLTLILLGSTSKAEISGARFHDHPPLLTTEKVELDIDGDGDLDYVSVKNPASHDGQLEVWVNLGGGRWKEPKVISTSIVDFELLAGDFNHDGYADLIVCDRSWRFSPELWIGGKGGSLERSPASFPLCGLAAGSPSSWSLPLHVPLVMVQQRRPNEHSKHIVLGHDCGALADSPCRLFLSFLVFPVSVFVGFGIPPRSPPRRA